MHVFRHKPNPVRAYRWQHDSQDEAIGVLWPELVFSLPGQHFYLSVKDLDAIGRCKAWLPLHPELPGDAGAAMPFAFFSVKVGRRVEIRGMPEDDENGALVRRALRAMEADESCLHPIGVYKLDPATVGIGDRDTGTVNPGQWVIRKVEGPQIVEVLDDSAFRAKYEPV